MKNQLRSHYRVKKWLNSVIYNRQIPLFRLFLPCADRLANFFKFPIAYRLLSEKCSLPLLGVFPG